VAPFGPCPGPAAVPAGATNVVTISGDIDGDTHADQVTSYSLAGVPHVHAALFTGGNSDTAVPIGFADTVEISFEDFDHSLGAAVPPPVAVFAIGAGNAGSAFVTFLTLTTHYCIKQWTLAGSPYTIRISQQNPYTGLVCEGAAGHVFYTEVNAEQQPAGTWLVKSSVITHNFTVVTLTPQPPQTVPDSPTIAHEYGDIHCGHPQLFP
jgi:hypothetical protein